MNVERNFKKIKKNFTIKKLNGYTNQSFIFIDKKNSTRTITSLPGVCHNHVPSLKFNSDWYHISYLDSLNKLSIKDLKKIKKTTQNLSCDLCDNNPSKDKVKKIKKYLKFFNFFIISHQELKAYFPEKTQIKSFQIARKHCRNLIIHSPEKYGVKIIKFTTNTIRMV